jgi:lysozyme
MVTAMASKPARTVIASLVLAASTLVGIASYEGYSDRAYTPIPGDVDTIGFGSTGGVKPGDTITPQRALVRLLDDAGKSEKAVKGCVTAPLYPYEFSAFVSLAYNIGDTAFCRSTLVKKANAEDYAGACQEILRWDRARGRQVPGLTKRRQAEYKQCMGGLQDATLGH